MSKKTTGRNLKSVNETKIRVGGIIMSKTILDKNRKSIIACICIFCMIFGTMQTAIDVNALESPDSSLQTISFGNFGINNGTYNHVGDLNAIGNYGASLDGTIFSANLIFGTSNGNQFRFGGKDSFWEGLIFTVSGTNLTMWEGANEFNFTPEIAGTTLIGAEINLNISTQFVDFDTDGLTDDVKLGIWFNDVLYNQSYIYLIDYAVQMGSRLSIYVPTAGPESYLTINSMQPDNTLRKISFRNFGVADANLQHNNDLVFLGDYSGSLDGTLFSGNVTFAGSSYMDIRFGGSTSYWHGLLLYKSGNNLYITDALGNTAEYLFSPLAAQTSFSDVMFNLKLSFQFVDSDTDGVKDDVKLGVWFNDILYENSFIYLVNYAPSLGKRISGYIGSATTPASALSVQSDTSGAQKSPDPYLANITFRHFGIADATHSHTGNLNASGTYPSSLDKTLFSGDVTFSGTASSDIRFGGTSAWYGLQIYRSGSMLYMTDVAGNTATYGFTSAMAGTNLVDAKFNLKISTQFVDSDIDGVKDDVKLGIWFNSILYENNYIYLTNYAPLMGSRLDLFVAALGGSIAVASANLTPAPDATLRTITFNNYGIADNTYTIGPDTDLEASGKHLGTLDDTLFSGNVTFGGNGGTEIRFGGVANAWTGLLFQTKTDNNNLYMQDAEALTSEYAFTPATAGVQLVAQSINLKISTQFIDYDNDGLKDDVRLGVWFNGVLYDANYIYLTDYAVKMGENLGIRVATSGSSLVVNSSIPVDIKMPDANLQNATFSNFGITDGTYNYTGDINATGNYGESLNGTLFSGNVTFGGAGAADIRFGGRPSFWQGLRFYTLNSNLYMEDVGGKTAIYGFGSVMAGTSFIGEEFNLQITTQFVDSDFDGSADDVRLGVWFNGTLYENNYIYLSDYAQYMGNFMGTFVHAVSSSISISSVNFVTLTGPDPSLTDITFGDFGISNSIYTFIQSSLSASGQYAGTLDEKLFSGNMTFTGAGVNLYIGGISSANQGLRFYSNGNNLYMQDTAGGTALYTFIPAVARTQLVSKQISMNISFQFVDNDQGGTKNDVKLGVWFNGRLYENNYIYLTNYTTTLGSKMGVGITSEENASMAIQSIVLPEADAIYDLAGGNYLVTGSGIIFINGNYSLAGAELSLPGEYKIIRYEDISQYTQYVVLYIRGDINCDNKQNNIVDLLELKKYLVTGSMKYIKAGKEAADINGDRTVDVLDLVNLKRIILKIDILEILPVKMTFSTAGGKDVMPIGGFYGPYDNNYVSPSGWVTPDYVTDSYFQLIKESGVNVINYTPNNYNSDGDTVASIRKGLALAEKYGIGMYVLDSGINNSMSTAEIASRIGNYSVFNSFLGIFINDEPGTSNYAPGAATLISQVSSLTARLNQYVNLMGYINLYPLNDTLGTAAQYETYLEEYCTTTDAKILSYDHYVFDAGSSKVAASYFENLSMARDAALAHNIPLWAYVQAGGNWRNNGSNADTGNYYPTENELLWNVNTLLAFGAKGIEYFPLIQPYYFANATTTEFDFDRNGLIAADGSTTEWYGYAQTANAQIAAVDEILLNSTSKGIIAKGFYAQQNTQNLTGMLTSYKELTSVSVEASENIPYLGSGAIVGCFDYNGKTALYVVNYNTSSSKTITLNFNNSYNFTVINSSGSISASGSTYSINSLQAGRAVLLVIG